MPGKKRAAKAPTDVSAADARPFPRQFFMEYFRFSERLTGASSGAQRRDLCDSAFVKVTGEHLPDAIPTSLACVMSRYMVMKHTADAHNIQLSDAFRARYNEAMKGLDGIEDFNKLSRVPIHLNDAAEDEQREQEESVMAVKKSKSGKKAAKKAPAKKAVSKKTKPADEAKGKIVKAKDKKPQGAHAVAREMIRKGMEQEDMVKALQKKFPDKAHIHVVGCIRNARKQVEAEG